MNDKSMDELASLRCELEEEKRKTKFLVTSFYVLAQTARLLDEGLVKGYRLHFQIATDTVDGILPKTSEEIKAAKFTDGCQIHIRIEQIPDPTKPDIVIPSKPE
jgi:hypothetical protein